jgi:hypothetical protein
MPQVKVGVASPDPVLQRADYSEAALARIAHVNEAIRLLKADCSAVGQLPAYTNITGQSSVAGLQTEVNAKLAAITAKLNALIVALS